MTDRSKRERGWFGHRLRRSLVSGPSIGTEFRGNAVRTLGVLIMMVALGTSCSVIKIPDYQLHDVKIEAPWVYADAVSKERLTEGQLTYVCDELVDKMIKKTGKKYRASIDFYLDGEARDNSGPGAYAIGKTRGDDSPVTGTDVTFFRQ